MSMNGTRVTMERREANDVGTRRVELRVRERTPACVADVIDDVTARLRRLEDAEVTEVQVRSWGQRCPGSLEGSVASTVAEYRQWAERSGYSLDPAFRQRETGSLISQDSRSQLIVPAISLAIYEDGDLACVTPCTDGTTTHTVEACLEALEAGATDLPADLGDRSTASVGDIG